jgi:hypothetical protein
VQVTTHVTSALMARLPVPRPADDSSEFARLVALSKRLSAGGIEANAAAYAELNAIAARLYAMSRDDYAHVLSTFPLISSELRDRCLAAIDRA